MKVLIVALTLVACVAADWVPKTNNEVNTIFEECRAANPLSDETLKILSGGSPMMEKEVGPVQMEAVRKNILCGVKKQDLFDEHQGYHTDRVAKQYKMNVDEVEKCLDNNEQNSSADVWAFRGHACLSKSGL